MMPATKMFGPLIGLLWLATAQAESIRDCSECPEMAELPAGSFQMGMAGRPATEPVRTVALPAFAIGKTEVTQGQWKAIMGTNPSKFQTCGEDCPVERITWSDAQEFVRRLSAKTGKTYRLPSEAEWEYACRAGQPSRYCGGDDPDKLAWYGDEYGSIHPAGSKQANAWGLHDMSGNVWEWTQDCMHPNYQGAPTDGSAWQEPDCKSRVLRGGSWLSGPQYGQAVIRFGFKPDFRAGDFGLRVAKDIR